MKCQHCPKLSTLQITEIHGENNFEEFHLCEECAEVSVRDFAEEKEERCFRRVGETVRSMRDQVRRFPQQRAAGSPHDYRAFQAELLPLLESIHSATRHAGKTPRRPSQQVRTQELSRLQGFAEGGRLGVLRGGGAAA